MLVHTQFLGSHYAGSCPELDGDGKAHRRPRQFEPAGVKDRNVNHNSAYALFAAASQNPPLPLVGTVSPSISRFDTGNFLPAAYPESLTPPSLSCLYYRGDSKPEPTTSQA